MMLIRERDSQPLTIVVGSIPKARNLFQRHSLNWKTQHHEMASETNAFPKEGSYRIDSPGHGLVPDAPPTPHFHRLLLAIPRGATNGLPHQTPVSTQGKLFPWVLREPA